MHTYLIQKGTTNVSVELEIIDSADGTPENGVVWNTAGIDLQYRRDAALSTAITEATLAALTTAHTDGGFLLIGNGAYRFDLPDAACASGVDKVFIHGTVTGMVVIPCVIQLVDYDPFDATRLGLAALPNAPADAAGGLPISDAGGLDLDGMNTTVASRMAEASINTTAGAIDNVTLVATTTTNTDMRGTDNAATEAKQDIVDANVDTLLTRIIGTLATGTHNPATAAQIAVLSDWINAGRLDLILDLILGDSGELQANQGNWATATGFATETKQDATDIVIAELTTQGDTNETALTNVQSRLPAALVAGKMDSDAVAVGGSTDGATRLGKATQANVYGTIGSGSTTTNLVTSALDPASAAIDQFRGKVVTFDANTTTANLRGQSTDITANTAGGVLTVTALTTAAVSGDIFVIT